MENLSTKKRGFHKWKPIIKQHAEKLNITSTKNCSVSVLCNDVNNPRRVSKVFVPVKNLSYRLLHRTGNEKQ